MPELAGPYPDRVPDMGDPEALYRTNYEVNARFLPYRHTRDGVNFHAEARNAAGLEGNETVLDVGCGDGANLSALRHAHGHQGLLIGVDLDQKVGLHIAQRKTNWHDLSAVEFIAGAAERLPLADNSVDVVMALFMLYHAHSPRAALREFQRVLRPGGKIVVATSGEGNKRRHRDFELKISKLLGPGVQPPPVLSADFNTQIARTVLPDYFEPIEEYEQRTEMVLTEDNYLDYVASLDTMKDYMSPVPKPGMWTPVMKGVIIRMILDEIAEKGAFTDDVRRYYYVGVNNKAA